MPPINFKAKILQIGAWTLVKLPSAASAKLPSRGMTMAEGTINNFHFHTPLEPDGKGGHWFSVEKSTLKGTKANEGDIVTLTLTPIKAWPEPQVPADFQKALIAAPQAHDLWREITPIARWDWIRWIRSTKQAETRKRRIEVACSKLTAGTRRPCCFNRSECTEPEVSNGGVLMEPRPASKKMQR